MSSLDHAAFLQAGSCEDWLQMAVKKVFRDVPADDLFVGFQSVGKPLAHPGGDLKTDVQQLPEVGIIMRR